MRKIIICLLLLLVSCKGTEKRPYTIAIDKNWYSIVLNGQEANLNGFLSEVLLTIAKNKKMEFKLIEANWDDIFNDLDRKKYQAIFSALEELNFNVAKYDFSEDIIKTGFVLITAKGAKYENLNDLSTKHVGYLKDSPSLALLQRHQDIFASPYDALPTLLDSIIKDDTQAAILSIIPAYKYVSDLYQNELKIIEPSLTDQAIRLVTLKDENRDLLNLFNKSLEKLKKDNQLDKLKEKWG
ncbi:MAG: L-cystine-binding protein FliY, partial [Candidatus Anoxychlamydiales bacterium]|nr:L-cystine-binding protein FliY [Candidatus Anoxychlamydiales bacterium]